MQETRSDLNHTSLLHFLLRWRKAIIIITILGAITSIVVSMMMTDKYKAVAVIAPTKTTSAEFSTNSKNNIAEFGDDSDALRLILILESPEIRDSLTVKYNLYEHYEIDPKEENAHYKFQKKYNNNVSFDRTRENAIEISVVDKKPEIAMNMANDIVRLSDTVMNRMIRESAKAYLWAVESEVELIRLEFGDYQDKLGAFRDSGVLGEEERADLYTNYISAVKLGDAELIEEIKRSKIAASKYGSDYDIASNLSDGFAERYVEILNVSDQIKQYSRNSVRQSHVRNLAELPDKKSEPKRMIIVLISTIASFLFACVLIIVLERIKELRAIA